MASLLQKVSDILIRYVRLYRTSQALLARCLQQLLANNPPNYVPMAFVPPKARVAGHLVIRRSGASGHSGRSHVARWCCVGRDRVHIERKRIRHLVAGISNPRAA